jgi:hypothetical protein
VNVAPTRVFHLGCFLTFAVAPAALAQNFSYADFASITGLTLNGSAVQSTNTVRITNNGSNQTGSVWHTTPVAVAEGFETQFDFVITSAAEGMAFVIQGSPAGAAALGGDNWGLGYGFGGNSSPITNSIAFEIDAAQNGFLNDTSNNEVSVHTTGALGNTENEGVSIARISPTTDLSNNAQHRIKIAYTPGTLQVFVNNLVTPAMTFPWTFESGGTQLTGGNTGGLGLAGINAWVGFTSSTSSGSSAQNASLRAWSWQSFFQPPPCYTGNLLVGSGGPHDVLTISGSNGGFFRVLSLKVADPFTLAVAPPPGQPSAPFVMLWTLGIANAATVTPTPWGDACFPPAVLDIGGFLAPHSLAVPPGIPLTLPFTFQAVMAPDPGQPSLIQLTNAVGLQFSLAPAPTITNVTPNSVPVGNTVTVNGNNFSQYATLDINGTPVPTTLLTATQITFAMPASVPCGATLRVRNPDGAQATAGFNPNPAITNQINTSGPAAGGTNYIVLGNGFAPGSTMTIGGVPANVTSSSATAIIVTTPPGTPGPRPVVITTPGGCTVNSTFTYL